MTPDARAVRAREDALIASADQLVRAQAARHAAKYVALGVAFEDLYADGLYGAFLAARSYDPTAGTAFTTWAFPYITRYMTVGVRFHNNEGTRGGRDADLTSLDQLREDLSADGTADFDLEDPAARIDPVQVGMRARIRDEVRRLTPRNRHLVFLTHWFGFGPTDAGRTVGISKSRARQLLAESYDDLRDRLGDLGIAA